LLKDIIQVEALRNADEIPRLVSISVRILSLVEFMEM